VYSRNRCSVQDSATHSSAIVVRCPGTDTPIVRSSLHPHLPPIMDTERQSEISHNPWLSGSERCAEFEGTPCCRLSQAAELIAV
jgi:hypothetical protein